MRRINTVPYIDVCLSLNLKVYQATHSSPLQWLLDVVNHRMIHPILPAMMKNTSCIKMRLKITPRQSDHTAHLWTTTRLYLNPPPESPKNWGQRNLNLSGYHSDPMEISSTVWIPNITNWWRQHGERHSTDANLTNVARDMVCITPDAVGVDTRFALGQDDIGWWRSKTTGETLRQRGVLRQFAGANNRILAGDVIALNMTNNENHSELIREVEEWKLHRLAKVHNILVWQGSQNLHATQKESQSKQAIDSCRIHVRY